jgi:hypothetical protein
MRLLPRLRDVVPAAVFAAQSAPSRDAYRAGPGHLQRPQTRIASPCDRYQSDLSACTALPRDQPGKRADARLEKLNIILNAVGADPEDSSLSSGQHVFPLGHTRADFNVIGHRLASLRLSVHRFVRLD